MTLIPARVSISAEWLERKLQSLKGRVFPPAATRADLRGQILADHTRGVRAGIIAEKVGLVLQNELVNASRRMAGSDFTMLVRDLLVSIDDQLALIVWLYGYPAYLPEMKAVHIHCDPILESFKECVFERRSLGQLIKANVSVTFYAASDAINPLYSMLEQDGMTPEQRSKIAFVRPEKGWMNPVVVIEREVPVGIMAAQYPATTREAENVVLQSKLPRDWMRPLPPEEAKRWLDQFRKAQAAGSKEGEPC